MVKTFTIIPLLVALSACATAQRSDQVDRKTTTSLDELQQTHRVWKCRPLGDILIEQQPLFLATNKTHPAKGMVKMDEMQGEARVIRRGLTRIWLWGSAFNPTYSIALEADGTATYRNATPTSDASPLEFFRCKEQS